MTKKLVVDQGYGFTKAMLGEKKIVFPSVLAPAVESGLDDTYSYSYGHVVEFRKTREIQKRKVFIGDLALKEGRAAQTTLSKDKYSQTESIVMILTAAYLVGAEQLVDIVVGLPLAYYKGQRQDVLKALQSVSAYVSVDGGPEKYISFSSVRVFPQGVGGIYTLSSLPENGLFGAGDIGFGTTDFYLFECSKNKIIPLKSYASSVEIGVHTAIKLFAKYFQEAHRYPLGLTEAQNFWIQKRTEITYRGSRVNIGPLMDKARIETGKAIAQTLLTAWSEKSDTLDQVYLFGGGALEFKDVLAEYFPLYVIDDPQWANVIGFNLISLGENNTTAKAARA